MQAANRPLREGMVVGLIGYASVAVFYCLFDLLAARGALYTVDLLGKVVFRGLRDPGVLQGPMRLDLMAIFWYNGLHLLIALAIGLTITSLAQQVEWHPSRARLIQFTIMAGFLIIMLAVGLLTTPIRPLLPWWSIVAANAIAALLAAWYLLRKRPGFWRLLLPYRG